MSSCANWSARARRRRWPRKLARSWLPSATSRRWTPAEDSVALFYLDGESRRGIHRRGNDFAIGDDVRSAADLRAEAAAHPERFSPNVLLRPIVQDRLFPTACYIAGPSELAYLAQLKGVYGQFGVEPPLLYSRASATILDSAAARFLDRYALPLEALQAQDDSSLNHLLESLLPRNSNARSRTRTAWSTNEPRV